MYCSLVFATLAVLIGNDFASAQQIPSTTTAAELWNPWTWFWPYAIATAEGYKDYYEKAQKATNELYQQIYKTNAFPWITGDWTTPPKAPGITPESNPSGGQQNNQNNSTSSDQGGSSQPPKEETSTQANQEQASQSTSEKPGQEGDKTQTTPAGTGAQVEGNVESDGTADAQVNGKVEEEKTA